MAGYYFRALLPILWAVTATVLALVLYRTSSALFEERRAQEGQIRRLRLVGSIVIAGVIFAGLNWATPKMLVTGLGPDQLAVSGRSLGDLQASVAAIGDAADRLDGCRALAPVQECGEAVADLKARVDDAQRKAKDLAPAKEASK